jgi:hypothetical protein
MPIPTERNLPSSPIYFAEEILELRLYRWQDRAISWFENAVGKRVKGSLCTPNGAGKDSIVIASLALWWISLHKRGRVVITSKDSRQIDEQTYPAIERHRNKFRGWRFIERYVETPTGGKIILFTTDEPGRAEGFHRETLENGAANGDGPLLLIANEAKSVPEGIFTAFDRCTFDGLLYASSPGPMSGRFYDSQVRGEMGFKTLQVGLKDCPHIPRERIADIIATYGGDAPFTRSTLHGEFMEADGEARFDRAGLEALREMAEAHHASAERGSLVEQEGWTRGGNTQHPTSNIQHPTAFSQTGQASSDAGKMCDVADAGGEVGAASLPLRREAGSLPYFGRSTSGGSGGIGVTTFTHDPAGWLWMSERPIPGCSYLGFCDPMTGEQSEGARQRDTHAAGILRAPYVDTAGVEHDAELVAALYVSSEEEKSGAACRWDNDVLAARLAMLLRFYGNCLCICEANNSGTEVIRLLLLEGCRLWRREKPNHRVPGRKMIDVVGFQTTSLSRNYWIGTLGTAIRERTLVCKFLPAVKQCATFILNEKGTGEAQAGCHDDWCTGLGLGLYQLHAATPLPPLGATVPPWVSHGPHLSAWPGSGGVTQGRSGACA